MNLKLCWILHVFNCRLKLWGGYFEDLCLYAVHDLGFNRVLLVYLVFWCFIFYVIEVNLKSFYMVSCGLKFSELQDQNTLIFVIYCCRLLLVRLYKFDVRNISRLKHIDAVEVIFHWEIVLIFLKTNINVIINGAIYSKLITFDFISF